VARGTAVGSCDGDFVVAFFADENFILLGVVVQGIAIAAAHLLNLKNLAILNRNEAIARRAAKILRGKTREGVGLAAIDAIDMDSNDLLCAKRLHNGEKDAAEAGHHEDPAKVV
jgi:hypothetical protein